MTPHPDSIDALFCAYEAAARSGSEAELQAARRALKRRLAELLPELEPAGAGRG